MDISNINRILQETAYIRTGGSEQELACANYLINECVRLGFSAHLEAFDVPMAKISHAKLIADVWKSPAKAISAPEMPALKRRFITCPNSTPTL